MGRQVHQPPPPERVTQPRLGPYWLDAQLPPQLAPWLTQTYNVSAFSASFLGYREATDDAIFEAARLAGAVVMSKDADFLERVLRLGSPPKLLYLTCGNTSTRRLREIFLATFEEAQRLLITEDVVEIGDPQP